MNLLEGDIEKQLKFIRSLTENHDVNRLHAIELNTQVSKRQNESYKDNLETLNT